MNKIPRSAGLCANCGLLKRIKLVLSPNGLNGKWLCKVCAPKTGASK